MAKTKITTSYDTSGEASTTIYAIIRRVSDGLVWSVAGTTWATWSDGSIGSYDLPLGSQNGDYFSVAFPTDIASGTDVNVRVYKQVGASPSVADYLLSDSEYTWSGTGLQDPADAGTTTSSVTIRSDALVSLDSMKRYLGITSDTYDTLLTELINAATAKIQHITGRVFAAGNYVEWIDGSGQESVLVNNYPIIRVRGVGACVDDAIAVSYTGSDIWAHVTVTSTGVRVESTAADGTDTSADLTFATYPTCSTMATAINAISGWTATDVTDQPSRWLMPKTYAIENGAECLTCATGIKPPAAYRASYGEVIIRPGAYEATPVGFGGLRFGQAGYGSQHIMVDYRGGFETIPDDVAQIAKQMVQTMYGMASKDTSVQSESLGSYSYTIADSLGMTEAQSAILASYTREVIA